jgi:phage terminase large subunit-like protein
MPKEESHSQKIASNMKRWHADPWAMVQDQKIWTLDQVDLANPIKTFPAHPWLELITREWEANKLLSIPKSRRMMITWLMLYLHLWLAMWHPGAAVFFVSESEAKSKDMIDKAEFVFRHIPDGDMLKPKIRTKHCLIEFPGLDSYIRGIPEGENQLRQYTATALLFDEWAFWERPMESLAAAKPCIQGGGRLTIVSTPGKDPFYDLCFDQRM